MDIADRERLIKLIGMLGSEHDGERANAAAFLQKMAAKYRMTITELMGQMGGGAPKVVYKEKIMVKEVFRDRPPPEPEASFTDVDSPLIARMKDVAAKPAVASRVLTGWELNFITDVSSRYEYDNQLSDKQLVIVERVLVKASRLFKW